MPVLDTGIHEPASIQLFSIYFMRIDVDGRIKSGHDEYRMTVHFLERLSLTP